MSKWCRVSWCSVLLVLQITGSVPAMESLSSAPNIIFIVADDLGWNDVGFHGSLQVPTPNIDALAYSGLILNNYYVHPLCSPSRSAIMTGRHPIHTGLQHGVISAPAPYGLPLHLSTLPQHLQQLGYAAQHVGKWHLGFYREEFTPTFRGFESHFGYWTGRIDYYDHTALSSGWGSDFRRGMDVARDTYGQYATDLFTSAAVEVIHQHNTSQPLFLYLAHLAVHSGNAYAPLQAPQEVVDRFTYIEDENRRTFAGMLTKLDESVGDVVEALQQRAMLQDSIIVFTTDNGGPAAGYDMNAASNWPLRGVKNTLWEGGVRGAAFVWSPLLHRPHGGVADQLMAVEDWLPSLYAAAGGDPDDLPTMDGVNMWPSLSAGSASARTSLLHNIDPYFDGAALRMGDWKLINNPSVHGQSWSAWYGPVGRNCSATECSLPAILQQVRGSRAGLAVLQRDSSALAHMELTRGLAMVNCSTAPVTPTFFCESTDPSRPCLFNIAEDPCELTDVSDENPAILMLMLQMLQSYKGTAVPPANKPWDPNADPKYWDYSWTNWMDSPPPVGVEVTALVEEEESEMGGNSFSIVDL